MSTGDDSFTERAFAAADAFARRSEAFTVREDAVPFPQGGSHRVVRGRWHNQPAVFKYYAYRNEACRVREAAALRHFVAVPGLPRLLSTEPERAIVMTEVRGEPLAALEGGSGSVSLTKLWQEAGSLIAQMTLPALSPDSAAAARQFVQDDLRCSRHVFRTQGRFRTAFFERSLHFIERQLETETLSRVCLCDRDLNPGNLLFDTGQLSGIVDLESCRPGTATEQAGIALYAACAYPFADESPESLWKSFADGWNTVLGTLPPAEALQAQCHRKVWATLHRDGAIRPDADVPEWYVAPEPGRMEQILRCCDRLSASA